MGTHLKVFGKMSVDSVSIMHIILLALGPKQS